MQRIQEEVAAIQGARIRITSSESQYSLEGGVVLQISGIMTLKVGLWGSAASHHVVHAVVPANSTLRNRCMEMVCTPMVAGTLIDSL